MSTTANLPEQLPEVVVIVPTLGRMERLGRVAENVTTTTQAPSLTLFVVEPHEYEVTLRRWPNLAVMSNRLPGHPGAFNAALEELVRRPGWKWWFHGADDLSFHAGWYQAAKRCARRTPIAQVIGTDDLLNVSVARGKRATHFLVEREYTQAQPAVPGVNPPHAYFMGYHHNFVETEFIDIARDRAVFVSCPAAIVEHLHPDAGKAPSDATYAKALSRWNDDKELYHRRRAERAGSAA